MVDVMELIRRTGLIVAFALAGTALAGCESFDLDKLSDPFSTKKPLPGERKPLFPGGVPGVPQGVPPDLIKGSQQPSPDANPPAVVAAPPEPAPQAEEQKPKPKPKKRTAQQPQPAQQQSESQPAQQQQPQTAWPPPPAQPAPWPSSTR